ncbi:MAG: hypothetical protein LBG79_04705 [Spirochaetaceae bacterium]|jgi:hypothetical protein|nr:hypothetical protein [Spirochaetaceae bacterium]GMO22783.1 MAG: hypothetical protein Pg6A_10050 [Termitinemataceae bacterium]
MNFINRTVLVLCGLFLTSLYGVWAQGSKSDDEDANSTIPIQSEREAPSGSVYQSGDKTFAISLGGLIPLGFTGADGGIKNNVLFGGTISLAYSYFLTGNIFVGGELQGSFNPTIGENFIFIVPFMARAGYQWVLRRFEFPVSFSIGGAGQVYNAYNLISFILKAQGAAYFRFNNDWSFGLNLAGWMIPQVTKESAKNTTGYFLEISMSARYNF